MGHEREGNKGRKEDIEKKKRQAAKKKGGGGCLKPISSDSAFGITFLRAGTSHLSRGNGSVQGKMKENRMETFH